jgi:hypothetical protein
LSPEKGQTLRRRKNGLAAMGYLSFLFSGVRGGSRPSSSRFCIWTEGPSSWLVDLDGQDAHHVVMQAHQALHFLHGGAGASVRR